MSTKAYVGVSGVAREITGGYIGVNGTARKITKAYIGDSNGVAKLIYEASSTPSGTPFSFNSNIIPTSWNLTTAYTDYKYSNTYGQWTIHASSTRDNSSSYAAQRAFNTSVSNQWQPASISSGNYEYIQLNFPVLINPTQFLITTMRTKNVAKLQLLNTSNVWVDAYNLQGETIKKQETINLSLSGYYTALRIYGTRYDANYPYFQVYQVYMQSGTGLQ